MGPIVGRFATDGQEPHAYWTRPDWRASFENNIFYKSFKKQILRDKFVKHVRNTYKNYKMLLREIKKQSKSKLVYRFKAIHPKPQ